MKRLLSILSCLFAVALAIPLALTLRAANPLQSDEVDQFYARISAHEPAENENNPAYDSTSNFIVRFDLPKDAPFPKGTFYLEDFEKHVNNLYTARIKNGEARLHIVPTAKMACFPEGLIGYTFKPQYDVNAKDGEEPFILTIKLDPAGLVYGHVLEHDGNPLVGGGWCKIVPVKLPENIRRVDLQYYCDIIKGEYLISPLPYDGTYRVLAKTSGDDNRLAASEEFRVDEEHPLHKIDIRFKQGITRTGTIIGPDHKPRSLGLLLLEYKLNDFGNESICFDIDPDGKFTLKDVSADFPGSITLSINASQDTQAVEIPVASLADMPLDITLEAGLKASGTIFNDANDELLCFATICLKPKNSSQCLTTETDGSGKFSFSNLQNVEYEVTIETINHEKTYPVGTTFQDGKPNYPKRWSSLKLSPNQDDPADFHIVTPPEE